MADQPRPMSDVTAGEPRVFRIADLEYRANSTESRAIVKFGRSATGSDKSSFATRSADSAYT